MVNKWLFVVNLATAVGNSGRHETDAIVLACYIFRFLRRPLKHAGLTYAKPHWREKKYLYLVYPCEGADRKREYVGTDEQKIKAAHAAIARAHEYDSLALQLAQIEKRMAEGRHYLNVTARV